MDLENCGNLINQSIDWSISLLNFQTLVFNFGVLGPTLSLAERFLICLAIDHFSFFKYDRWLFGQQVATV